MTYDVRALWENLDAHGNHPGPFSIWVARIRPLLEEPAYSTRDPHFVFWNGFPIHSESLDQNAAFTLIEEFE